MTHQDIYFILNENSMIIDFDLAPSIDDYYAVAASPAAPVRRPHANQWTARKRLREEAAAAAGIVAAPDPDHDPHQVPTVELPTNYRITWDPMVVEQHVQKWERKKHLTLKPEKLQWSPFLVTRGFGLEVDVGSTVLEEGAEPSAATAVQSVGNLAAAPLNAGTPLNAVAGPGGVSRTTNGDIDGFQRATTPTPRTPVTLNANGSPAVATPSLFFGNGVIVPRPGALSVTPQGRSPSMSRDEMTLLATEKHQAGPEPSPELSYPSQNKEGKRPVGRPRKGRQSSSEDAEGSRPRPAPTRERPPRRSATIVQQQASTPKRALRGATTPGRTPIAPEDQERALQEAIRAMREASKPQGSTSPRKELPLPLQPVPASTVTADGWATDRAPIETHNGPVVEETPDQSPEQALQPLPEHSPELGVHPLPAVSSSASNDAPPAAAGTPGAQRPPPAPAPTKGVDELAVADKSLELVAELPELFTDRAAAPMVNGDLEDDDAEGEDEDEEDIVVLPYKPNGVAPPARLDAVKFGAGGGVNGKGPESVGASSRLSSLTPSLAEEEDLDAEGEEDAEGEDEDL